MCFFFFHLFDLSHSFLIVLEAFFLENAKAGNFLSFSYHLYTIMTARRGKWRGNWHITNLLFIQSLIIPHRHRSNHFSLYLWHKKFEFQYCSACCLVGGEEATQ